jgi:dolichol-phosphate mannosyltransferase
MSQQEPNIASRFISAAELPGESDTMENSRAYVPSSQPDLAIIIPAINERENLELLIPATWDVLSKLGVNAEIIVVDGGSTDGTIAAAEHRGARVVQQNERGYGGALLAGFSATTAPYLITMDADLSHRPSFLAQMWNERSTAHVLIASRYVENGEAEMPISRRFLSRILNVTYARVLSLPFKDLSSGFRMYRADVLHRISLTARDFDVLEEILIRIYAEGWSIRELPFRYMARGSGKSHAKLVKFGIAYLKTLGRMWKLRNSVESADYDYRAFDSPIWLQRYWQRTRHRILLDFTDANASVLDIGCGSARTILDLPNAVGLDILLRKLRFIQPRHGKVIQGSCTALPFEKNSFDVVINSEVIEHLPDDPAIMEEMWRVLRPGGTLILGTPDYGTRVWVFLEWVYGKVLPGAYAHEHITHFTYESLHQRLVNRGFQVLDCKYVGYGEMIFKARKPAVAHDAVSLAAIENTDVLTERTGS